MLAQITISISDKDFYGTVGVLAGLILGVTYTIIVQTHTNINKRKK